jgi:hypothetical protein
MQQPLRMTGTHVQWVLSRVTEVLCASMIDATVIAIELGIQNLI